MSKLDLKLFRETMFKEMADAWRSLKAAHPREHFYSFGLYTSELVEYLMVTASTEEGLTLITNEYVARSGGDPALVRAGLRWSPCDSPRHSEGTGLLPQSERLRMAGPDPYDETDEAEGAIVLVMNTAMEALRELDRQKMFGSDLERAQLVLGIWKGDQSDEERVDFARGLNPANVVDRFTGELRAGNEASFELARRSSSS